MKRLLEHYFPDAIARRRERRRNGPYPSQKALIWGLVDLRYRIDALDEPPVRAFLQTADRKSVV